MKKTFKRFLSVFLAVLMVITVIPMGVYAAETEETEVIQVSELEESRDLYSKTYETSEDTNVVISAAVPLHYEENGELKDIDNTLVKSEEDSSVLTNVANAYNVELPNKYTDDSEIKVDYENNSIRFKLLNNVKSSKGDITETETAEIDESNAESVAYAESNMAKLSSAITYENLLPNTDFEYNVQPDALKENIILNKIPDANYVVQYELITGNLDAVLNGDNTITVSDDNKEIFMIESPYMIDANDTISEDVTVSLEKSENGYILTYIPDYSWLSSENTAYPVTIDPTIAMLKIEENIKDSYYSEYYEENYTDDEAVTIQNNSDDNCIGFYQFQTLPFLPNGSKLINSKLHLFLIYDSDNETEFENSISAYILNDSAISDIYDINDSVFNSLISNSNSAIDAEFAKSAAESEFHLDITKAINKWYQNKNDNKILYIKNTLQNVAPISFASTESGYDRITPYISIEYKEAKGINNNYNYITNDVNSTGKTYINVCTGKLTLEQTDFKSNGSIKDIIFYTGDTCNAPDNNFLGENVSMNYYKTLEKDSINGSEYIITSGDGSKYYSSEIDSFSIDDISAEEIKISYIENNTNISETYIANSKTTNLSNNGNKYVLSKISTLENNATSGNTVNIIYSNSHISQISDEISKFTLTYKSNKINRLRKQHVISNDVLSANANDSAKDVSVYYGNSFCKYENCRLQI